MLFTALRPTRPHADRPAPPPEDSRSGDRVHHATATLRTQFPELSAATGLWPWQRAAFVVAAILLLVGLTVAPASTLSAILTLAIAPFACVIAIRVLALAGMFAAGNGPATPPTPTRDGDLPTYTALVPLYREARVIGQLTRALARLDYPPDRLQILLIVEEGDWETRAALHAAPLPTNARVVQVPPGAPQTKPRALNYALQEATGDLVVVYDAEDEPDLDQLRHAAAAFRSGGARLGCVQAHLRIYNADHNWLTRQFAIEYAALFACILPALQRFGLPITLSGTSNHFPRRTLHAVGGWDPHNVTEDADLGIRLSRLGWNIEILSSATWEEAPPDLTSWIRQRTRWLKGWMQTLLVHTRQPRQLARDLGPVPLAAFIVLMSAMVLSSLVHPWFYGLTVARAFAPERFGTPDYGFLWWLGCLNLLAGYLVGIAVSLLGTHRSGYAALARNVVFIPIYWLLISLAAYAAIYELLVAPFRWNKTPHVGRSVTDSS